MNTKRFKRNCACLVAAVLGTATLPTIADPVPPCDNGVDCQTPESNHGAESPPLSTVCEPGGDDCYTDDCRSLVDSLSTAESTTAQPAFVGPCNGKDCPD